MSDQASKQAEEAAKITAENPSTLDKLSAAAGEAAAKAEELFDKARTSEYGQKAEAAWEKVEDKAEELLDKAKNSEWGKKAEEALDKLEDKAEALWDKLTDALDGDEKADPEKKD